jgi:pimeloyl-ACP methyl ester carboxylesterase
LGQQNYLGLALRAPLPAAVPLPGRFRWSARRRPLYQQIELLLAELGQHWNIHPHRIVLMGQGAGAVLALRIWLRYRHSFAGAIAIHPPEDWPNKLPPLQSEQPGRVFLSGVQAVEPQVMAALDGLCEAGIDVNVARSFELSRQALGQEVNRWIMAGISSAIV